MAWILGIGVALALLFTFPKQMMGLIGLLVVAAALFWGWLRYDEYQAAKTRKSVSFVATSDGVTCTPDFPIKITISNQNAEPILSITFSLAGYRDGYSTPVYISRSYKTDRIMLPGYSYENCWTLPEISYGQKEADPKDLSWKATYSYATFGTAP